jgi:hypothetical protein
MSTLSPDEVIAIIAAALVLLAAGFLHAAGETGWKGLHSWLRRRNRRD